MPGRPLSRSFTVRAFRPVLAAIDARIERLAARLELHTVNLANDQRRELARLDDRLAVDAAVSAEHLLAVERIARRAVGGLGPHPVDESVVVRVALPGEVMTLPAGARLVACYAPRTTTDWQPVANADAARTDTLRIATLPSVAN